MMSTSGGIRTHNTPILSRMPLPIGLRRRVVPALRGRQQRDHTRIAAVSNESSTTRSRRVLVAEDETLTDAGYEVVAEASDGEEAVHLADEHTPDLCVLDVKMPVTDGITAAERILEKHNCAVVMLTAFSQTELVERASAAGAMAYVVKPFTPADLIPALEIAMSRHEEIISLESEISDLTERFETRKRVDRAKGLLMERMGLSEPEAFRWLQKTSMNRRLTMREVADAVIEQVGAGKKD